MWQVRANCLDLRMGLAWTRWESVVCAVQVVARTGNLMSQQLNQKIQCDSAEDKPGPNRNQARKPSHRTKPEDQAKWPKPVDRNRQPGQKARPKIQARRHDQRTKPQN